MTKHTKGPWEARDGEVTTQQISGRSYRRIAAIQDYGVGSLKEIDEANAHLIAAAPDLLVALEAWVDSTSLADEVGSMRPVYLAARAAIAKATGENVDNAGCDNCGTFDRVEGSKLCEQLPTLQVQSC